MSSFIGSLCDILYFGGATSERSFRLPVAGEMASRGCIVHGDLNGRNLTWSNNYRRFFIIDFEHVGRGFWGADQLKLVASLLGETAPTAINFYSSTDGTRRDNMENVHKNIMHGVGFIDELVGHIHPHGELDQLLMEEKNDVVMLKLIKEIVRTIDLPANLALEHGFWRFALICVMYRQFEYAVREIDSSCIPLLDQSAIIVDRRAGFDLSLLDERDEHVLSRVVALQYSFRALLASIPSTPDNSNRLA